MCRLWENSEAARRQASRGQDGFLEAVWADLCELLKDPQRLKREFQIALATYRRD